VETRNPERELKMKLVMALAVGVIALSDARLATAAERVTVDNFTRVETDYYFKNRFEEGCFGKFCSEREPRGVDRQAVIRMNRDTPYSNGCSTSTHRLRLSNPIRANVSNR
jgi:hypothetical protein